MKRDTDLDAVEGLVLLLYYADAVRFDDEAYCLDKGGDGVEIKIFFGKDDEACGREKGDKDAAFRTALQVFENIVALVQPNAHVEPDFGWDRSTGDAEEDTARAQERERARKDKELAEALHRNFIHKLDAYISKKEKEKEARND